MSNYNFTKYNKFDKNMHSVPYRINCIQNLVDSSPLDPMIDLECYTNSSIKGCSDIKKYNKTINFYYIIKKIGCNGEVQYIKSGSTGHTFKGTSKNGINYAIKVVAYTRKDKYGDIDNNCRPENAELAMIKLLSEFVVAQQTPHVVLPICTFNTVIKPFIDCFNKSNNTNPKYKAFIDKYKKKAYYDTVSVLISEWANGGDLLDFIRKYSSMMKLKHWKVIFFQTLSVLAVIQKKYPSFRHNDLKANNVLIELLNSDNDTDLYFDYIINGKYYSIPNINIQIKIWDFDFACIPEIIDNDKVSAEWTNKINVRPEKNRYYDMHYFFNTLTKKGFFPEFWTSKHVPEEVREFITRVVPLRYREGRYVGDRGRLLCKKEFTTPNKVLCKDIFFEEFRK